MVRSVYRVNRRESVVVSGVSGQLMLALAWCCAVVALTAWKLTVWVVKVHVWAVRMLWRLSVWSWREFRRWRARRKLAVSGVV